MGCLLSTSSTTAEDGKKNRLNGIFRLPDERCSNDIDPDQTLLAMKGLYLCQLTYLYTQAEDPEHGVIDKAIEKSVLLKLQIKELYVWRAPAVKLTGTTNESAEDGALAISGIMSNWSNKIPSACPFIAFRGTSSLSDVGADLISLFPGQLKSRKGGPPIGTVGSGFVLYLDGLCKVRSKATKGGDGPPEGMTMLEYVIAKSKELKSGIIITGHSLGGGVASACATLIHHDEDGKIPITLLTFGCPRVYEQKTAARVYRMKNIHHTRYVNENDLIVILGDQGGVKLKHTGNPLLFGGTTESDGARIDAVIGAPNFPENLPFIQILRLTREFIATEGRQHLIHSSGGYFAAVQTNKVYQEALKSLLGDLKASFALLDGDQDFDPPISKGLTTTAPQIREE